MKVLGFGLGDLSAGLKGPAAELETSSGGGLSGEKRVELVVPRTFWAS